MNSRSLIAPTDRMDVDVDRRLAQASKAFDALRKAVLWTKIYVCLSERKCIMPVSYLCCYMVQNAGSL